MFMGPHTSVSGKACEWPMTDLVENTNVARMPRVPVGSVPPAAGTAKGGCTNAGK